MKPVRILLPILLVLFLFSPAYSQMITGNGMLANWNITLKPDVAAERFEKFMTNEYIPTFEKNFTGIDMILLKGERGVKKDGYCILLIFKSIQDRNEWWPSEGISSEKTKAAGAKMQTQDNKLNLMITWESFTDWIVL